MHPILETDRIYQHVQAKQPLKYGHKIVVGKTYHFPAWAFWVWEGHPGAVFSQEIESKKGRGDPCKHRGVAPESHEAKDSRRPHYPADYGARRPAPLVGCGLHLV